MHHEKHQVADFYKNEALSKVIKRYAMGTKLGTFEATPPDRFCNASRRAGMLFFAQQRMAQ
jgi:hypothetical protein